MSDPDRLTSHDDTTSGRDTRGLILRIIVVAFLAALFWHTVIAAGADADDTTDAFERATAPGTAAIWIKRPFGGRSSTQRYDQTRRNTTLRLFAGISVTTGTANPTDCAVAATDFEVT